LFFTSWLNRSFSQLFSLNWLNDAPPAGAGLVGGVCTVQPRCRSASLFLDKYKKQRWKKPCSTIFAHLEKDGNRFIHPDSRQARTITPREVARIQSFPDWYEFEGPFTKKFGQIGNAVPPLLALAIAKSLAEKMGVPK